MPWLGITTRCGYWNMGWTISWSIGWTIAWTKGWTTGLIIGDSGLVTIRFSISPMSKETMTNENSFAVVIIFCQGDSHLDVLIYWLTKKTPRNRIHQDNCYFWEHNELKLIKKIKTVQNKNLKTGSIIRFISLIYWKTAFIT